MLGAQTMVSGSRTGSKKSSRDLTPVLVMDRPYGLASMRNTLRRFNLLYTDKQVLACHLIIEGY